MKDKTYVQGLCEWCGNALSKSSVTMKVSDDCICPSCYWDYRKDKQYVKSLWKGVEKHG